MWNSTNNTVAQVSGAGVVDAQSAGTTTIQASAGGQTGSIQMRAVDADLAANQTGIGPVATSPEVVAEHDDGVRALRRVLLRQEGPTDLGPDAHDVEVVAGDDLAKDELGVSRFALEARRDDAVVRDGLEDVGRALFDQLEVAGQLCMRTSA